MLLRLLLQVIHILVTKKAANVYISSIYISSSGSSGEFNTPASGATVISMHKNYQPKAFFVCTAIVDGFDPCVYGGLVCAYFFSDSEGVSRRL